MVKTNEIIHVRCVIQHPVQMRPVCAGCGYFFCRDIMYNALVFNPHTRQMSSKFYMRKRRLWAVNTPQITELVRGRVVELGFQLILLLP